jgi:hypothetical protein
MIRSATPGDARAIATIHVEAWRAAYRGIVPDEYLDSLSIDGRESTWRQNLLAAEPQPGSHKNPMPLSGGSQLDRAAIRMLIGRQVRFGLCMSHRNAGGRRRQLIVPAGRATSPH